jgi:hypothetical protein
MVISSSSARIDFLSYCFSGRTHDSTLLQTVFPTTENWFENHVIQGDLGYLGIDKSYCCGRVELPVKKKKHKELSLAEKSVNQKLNSERVVVEHGIGGMKRYRVLSNRLRMHDLQAYDRKLEICAGLWNFYLSC